MNRSDWPTISESKPNWQIQGLRQPSHPDNQMSQNSKEIHCRYVENKSNLMVDDGKHSVFCD